MSDTPPTTPGIQRESHPKLSGFQKLGKGVLERVLAGITDGQITVNHAGQSKTYGTQDTGTLYASVEVLDNQFFQRVAFGGELGAAESYLRSDWNCDDLTSLFRILIRNIQSTDHFSGGVQWVSEVVERIGHWLSRNTKTGSQRNIHAHYDLGNDFFSLFLDPTMTYSSGIFPSSESSMEEGSIFKIDRICRLLNLGPEDHVLEIGTGWGSFAMHAAQHYGCRITSTTISREQHEFAMDRIRHAGLDHQVELLLCDYRELEGHYDKLASIEMIEAVGHRFLDTYFTKCSSLLKPNGLMALQAITMNEQRYQLYVNSVDFIQKYIFPGGCLPSVNTINNSVGRVTDMRPVQLDDFAEHYAKTLSYWRDRFYTVKDDVLSRFDERFFRTWDYYFCYCEAAFLERYCGVCQFLFAKSRSRHDHIVSQIPSLTEGAACVE